ncbi:ShlB/FhaC/HecB family hemolysin secretion/activation protein [Proteus sp. FME41]|uniref:ShlB/FhaC/HecB family hemolysin secretion/activation protein n=1 Tax=Proteus sp. FME41 TaxID=2742608 RepID=UPI001868AC9D|nr:ShlB/FhaC/HecB family hemolysin secretion/activation protein [Proteus sp. FME41]
MQNRLSVLFLILFFLCFKTALANTHDFFIRDVPILTSEDMLKDKISTLKEESLPLQGVTTSKAHIATLSSCFPIKQVNLHNQQYFTSSSLQHALDKWKKRLESDCHTEILLEQDINILNAILYDAGYITSEAGKVDLFADRGLLDITLKVGRVEDIIAENRHSKSRIIAQVMPVKRGDILNINDIEQGVSNLKDKPNSKVKVVLKVGSYDTHNTLISINQVGESTFNGSLSIDNKEKKMHGDLFGEVKFNFGNLLQLNDSLSLIFSRNLGGMKSQGIKKSIFFFKFPYRYWRFSLLGYQIDSKNKISNAAMDRQRIQQQHFSFDIQRQFRPSQQRTVTLMAGLQYYTYHNTLFSKNIDVHERRSPYITLGVKQYYRLLRGGNINVKLNYKQSIPLKGAKLSPIHSVNGVPIFNVEVDALIPFKAVSYPFFYQPKFSVQLTKSEIDGLLDKSTIGGLNSVYGFASGTGYSAENQFLFRQKLSWLTPVQGQLLFSALDYGSVSKRRGNIFHNKEKYLVGFAVGLEGSVNQLNYQVIVGIPLLTSQKKPNYSPQLTFSGKWNF